MLLSAQKTCLHNLSYDQVYYISQTIFCHYHCPKTKEDSKRYPLSAIRRAVSKRSLPAMRVKGSGALVRRRPFEVPLAQYFVKTTRLHLPLLRTAAGLPTTVTFDPNDFVTVDPIPTIVLSPIVILFLSTAFMPT